MVKISVLTPTTRGEKGLREPLRALNRQGFTDYEHIINKKRYEGGFWGLNRAYNSMLKQAKGELIVSWQDYTFAKPDCLQKFWDCYQANKKTIVGAVGNKYRDNTWMVKTWQDPRQRQDQGIFYECYPWDIEANLCAVPKKAFYDIGGFDEKMDFIGFGFDARGVFERIDTLDYKFYLDQSNESFSLEHGRLKGWDENNMIDKWTQYKKTMLDKSTYPVLKYL